MAWAHIEDFVPVEPRAYESRHGKLGVGWGVPSDLPSQCPPEHPIGHQAGPEPTKSILEEGRGVTAQPQRTERANRTGKRQNKFVVRRPNATG